MDLLSYILVLLGSSQTVDDASPEKAMAIVQEQYAESGVPEDLTATERESLHVTASDALRLLNAAPSSVDSASIASFRPTLRDIMFETAPPAPTPSDRGPAVSTPE